jgi:adenosylcobinamide-GDP ribazoletransferase
MRKELEVNPTDLEEDSPGISALIRPILAAGQYLTLLPTFVKRAFTRKEVGRAVGFFPLVGLAIGVLLLGADTILSFAMPQAITAALVLGLWVLLTGAQQLDGFLDAMDGLFGGRTPEKRLQILQDERMGTFAFAGGTLLLLLKFTALASLDSLTTPLLLAPTLGRWAMTLAIPLFPYEGEDGRGRAMKENSNWRQIEVGTIIAMLVGWFTWGWYGLILLPVALLATMVMANAILERIPGLTEDIYGVLCEVTETVLLLCFVVMQSSL